jgi:hypothetical protein
MPETLTPDAFRRRFALATFRDGGVVLDLATGSYSQLNASGAAVLRAFFDLPDDSAVIAAIAEQFRVETSVAEGYLKSIVDALLGEGLRYEPPDPFRYLPSTEGGYDVWHDARLALHVAPDGRRLILRSAVADLPLPLYDYVSGIAPKVLFLRGICVMHGSSCISDSALLGFCGKSRAGKTTTARTFARHGRRLVSEDLLLFAPDLTKPQVFVEGERLVNAWSREATAALAAGVGASTETEGLVAAASGERMPLAKIWFLDAARRGLDFIVRPLGPAEALPLVMANQFLGGSGDAGWRRHLANSQAVANSVTAFALNLPDGLDQLDRAIGNYITKSAS